MRAGWILKAGRVVREELGLGGRRVRWLVLTTSVLAAVFVLVLADPSSRSREVGDQVVDPAGLPGVILAGLLLGATTFLLFRRRRERSRMGP